MSRTASLSLVALAALVLAGPAPAGAAEPAPPRDRFRTADVSAQKLRGERDAFRLRVASARPPAPRPFAARPRPATSSVRWQGSEESRGSASAFSALEAQLEAQDAAEAGRPELAIEHRPDGSDAVLLDDRFMEYAVVRLGPDGKPEMTCVQGPAAAEKARTAPVPARAAKKPAPAPEK